MAYAIDIALDAIRAHAKIGQTGIVEVQNLEFFGTLHVLTNGTSVDEAAPLLQDLADRQGSDGFTLVLADRPNVIISLYDANSEYGIGSLGTGAALHERFASPRDVLSAAFALTELPFEEPIDLAA
jgi:hypothetical protein